MFDATDARKIHSRDSLICLSVVSVLCYRVIHASGMPNPLLVYAALSY